MNLFKKLHLPSITLIIIGVLAWSATMVKSGWVHDYGMGFWGPNGHDGIWHISVIESLLKGGWEMPIYAGEVLRNYHIGFALFVALIHKLTLIPVSTLYFQILPPLFAIGIGISVYMFMMSWTRSKSQTFWTLFFVYFAGSWGWLINLIRGQGIGGESMFWSQQSISTLVNPPYAFSLLILMLGLNILMHGHRNQDSQKMFIATIMFGLLIQIKVYAGILVIAGLFVSAFWEIIRCKGFSLFKVASGALLISILVFVPLNGLSTSTLVFSPFWFIDSMMAISDRLYWPKFAEALLNYRLADNYLKLFFAYFVAIVIFWYGNLGSRILFEKKVWDIMKNWKHITYIEVILVTILVLGFILPLTFVQRGTPWNTIQFLYYSLFICSIFAGMVFGEYFVKVNTLKKTLFSIVIILLTLPTTIGTLTQYLPDRPPAKLSHQEIEALEFLKKQPSGVVLTYPYDPIAAQIAVNNPPRPLRLYESTAYVSAYSAKPVYLEDEVNLTITGYEWKERRAEIEEFYTSLDEEYVYNFLQDNKITYLYWIKGQRARLGETQLGIERIFENGEVDIYRVGTAGDSLK